MPPKSRTTAAPALGRLASDLRLSCMRISRRVRFESTHVVAPHQLSVIARLDGSPRTPGELADIERVSAPSMTRTVAGLVELGYVSRSGNPEDGRQVIVSLTDEGADVLRDTRRRRDQWMATRLKGLSPEEIEILARASTILSRVAGE